MVCWADVSKDWHFPSVYLFLICTDYVVSRSLSKVNQLLHAKENVNFFCRNQGPIKWKNVVVYFTQFLTTIWYLGMIAKNFTFPSSLR